MGTNSTSLRQRVADGLTEGLQHPEPFSEEQARATRALTLQSSPRLRGVLQNCDNSEKQKLLALDNSTFLTVASLLAEGKASSLDGALTLLQETEGTPAP